MSLSLLVLIVWLATGEISIVHKVVPTDQCETVAQELLSNVPEAQYAAKCEEIKPVDAAPEVTPNE